MTPSETVPGPPDFGRAGLPDQQETRRNARFADVLGDPNEVYFPIRICGNHGDSMIWNGLCHLFCQTGGRTCGDVTEAAQEYPIFRPHEQVFPLIPEEATTVVINGGGNINDIWGFGVSLLEQVLAATPASVRVIIGPQSYWFKRDRFQQLLRLQSGRQMVLFARERYSYQLLQEMDLPANIRIGLDHDLALRLPGLPAFTWKGDYDLVCFRNDRESTGPKTANVAKPVNLPMPGPITYQNFLRAIGGARRIVTDRLHVAIAGHLMHKPVELYPNNYHKIRGVYEYSLQGGSVTLKSK